jgi:hypothetical protein
MQGMRAAIENGTFKEFKQAFATKRATLSALKADSIPDNAQDTVQTKNAD